MSEREWFYNAACDWYDGPPVIEIRDGKEYLLRIPHRIYYNGTTNIPKVERCKKTQMNFRSVFAFLATR